MDKNKKMTVARLRAMERKRKQIQNFFLVYHAGNSITLDSYYNTPKLDTHILLAKYECEGKYYFILLSKYNRIYLMRIITVGMHVSLIKVPRTSKEYLSNKEIFDNYIKLARENIEKDKAKYFKKDYKKHETIAVRCNIYNEDGVTLYKFMSKHKHNGKYYFIVRNSKKEFFVAKVVWFEFAKLIHVSEKEKINNAQFFDSWIKEAKIKSVINKKVTE